MAVKDKVLRDLENNRGKYISGEALAGSLGVTRNSVWKAIKSLEGQGYEILGVPNKGYMLKATSDVLSVQGIEKYIEQYLKNYWQNIIGAQVDVRMEEMQQTEQQINQLPIDKKRVLDTLLREETQLQSALSQLHKGSC
mgnify:CR=1 FL=1